MPAGSTDVVVKFLADVSDIQSGVKDIDKKVGGLSKGLKTAVAGIGIGVAANEMSGWVSAAEEAESVSAGLAQALKNAGDATGTFDKHAEDLSETLMKKTGIDDEVIKSAQTILATFHGLAGAAGQQSGAFDRATQAALDLSKAGFGDASSAATMLGKALEDPEKGLTALGRVGITFSEDQKKAIKAMVESGDKAGAMGLILQNVEGQVGGVAEATVTSSDKMKVAWGETEEALGKALLPVLEKLAPILEKIAKFVEKNATWLIPLLGAVVGLVVAMKAWMIVQTAMNTLLGIFGAVSGVALGPLLLIALAIAALVIAAWLLWNNWDTVWTSIQNATAAVTDFILTNWQRVLDFFGSIPAWIQTRLGNLGNIIVWPFQWAWNQIIRIKDGIVDTFGGIGESIGGAFVAAFNFVADAWNNTIGAFEFTTPSWLDPIGLGNKFFAIPNMNKMASGGIVTRPTLALLGEAGPEAVVPLGRTGGGPAVFIENAQFNDPVDVDVLSSRLEFALSAGLPV